MKKKHLNFDIKNEGLFLDPLHHFLGATPDGLISCNCCENEMVEIKCPYSCKDKDMVEASEVFSCIKVMRVLFNSPVTLSGTVANETVPYYDFVVWNKKS